MLRLPAISRTRLTTGVLLIALAYSPWLSVRAWQAQRCEGGTSQMMGTVVPSAIYRTPQAVNVYVPPCYAADHPSPYPVIYLLHGGSADETQWPDLNVQSAADTLIGQGTPPFVVVMPGAPYGVDYARYVIHDLLPGIETRYQVQAVRAGRAIGGLSLGGYWALRIALSQPDLFAAVGGFSPVVDLGYADDPLRLAHRVSVQTLQGLRIMLDVGDADSLAYDTNQLALALRAQGLTVPLTVGHGGHNRAYWRAHTDDYFSFFMSAIAVPPVTTPEPKGIVF
jgi:enterochelin esterase-like enzyme